MSLNKVVYTGIERFSFECLPYARIRLYRAESEEVRHVQKSFHDTDAWISNGKWWKLRQHAWQDQVKKDTGIVCERILNHCSSKIVVCLRPSNLKGYNYHGIEEEEVSYLCNISQNISHKGIIILFAFNCEIRWCTPWKE